MRRSILIGCALALLALVAVTGATAAPASAAPATAVAAAPVGVPAKVGAQGQGRGFDLGRAVRRARNYAGSRAGSVSFAFRGLGARRAFDGRRTYASASVVKVMLLLAYLRQRSGRELRGSEKRLLRPMIRRSEDSSASRVRDLVGNSHLDALADRIGLDCFATDPNWGATRICANDMASLIKRLPRLLPSRHRGFAMRQLRRIVPIQRWGIPEVVGWTPYFKGGWFKDPGGWRTHQIALLRSPSGREVSIAVLSSGQPNREYGRATIRGVAKRLVGRLAR